VLTCALGLAACGPPPGNGGGGDGGGTGVAMLTITEAQFDYGMRVVGSQTDHTFTVSNGGMAAATMLTDGGTLSGSFSFKGGFPGGNCGASLDPGASCTVVVSFKPTSVSTSTTMLTLTYQTSSGAQSSTAMLSGSGVTAAKLGISDAPSFGFGPITLGASGEHTFTVTNSGGAQAGMLLGDALTAPFAYKGGTFPGTGGTCTGTTIDGGASCTVVVDFTPTAVVISSGTFTIEYDDGLLHQTTSTDLSGTGVAPAALSISDGATFDFGPQPTGSSTDHTFTVTNAGGAAMQLMPTSGLTAPSK
jgi:hypothetical protein